MWPGNRKVGCLDWCVVLWRVHEFYSHRTDSHALVPFVKYWWGQQVDRLQKSQESAAVGFRCFWMTFLVFGLVEASGLLRIYSRTGEWLRALTTLPEALGFSSQTPHGGFQPPLTPVPREPMFLFDFPGHQACMWCMYTLMSKHVYTLNK